jgi:hypothetical protein
VSVGNAFLEVGTQIEVAIAQPANASFALQNWTIQVSGCCALCACLLSTLVAAVLLLITTSQKPRCRPHLQKHQHQPFSALMQSLAASSVHFAQLLLPASRIVVVTARTVCVTSTSFLELLSAAFGIPMAASNAHV